MYSACKLDDVLPGYLRTASTLYCDFGRDETHDRQLFQFIRLARSIVARGAPGPSTLRETGILLDDLRIIKRPEEQALLRRAADITAEAHREAMTKIHPGQNEYELQALAEYIFRCHGSARNAYPSIVGSGRNATILHYQANTRQMLDGDLVLLDAAAEYGYYAMDLTRTIPVNGTFTAAQREMYDIVLEAQQAALARVRPGSTLAEVHMAAVETITAGLARIGLLQGEVEHLITGGAYKPYFMHGTSHWIGLDIRDRGQYTVNGQSRRLEPGMVFSVEPGLYFGDISAYPSVDSGILARYRDIGIRIEDTVLVTADGCEILTAAAPKDPDAIEALMTSAGN